MAIQNQVRIECDFCDEKTIVGVAPDGSVPPALGWIVVSRDTAKGTEKYIACSTKCLLRAADRYATNPATAGNLVGIDGKKPA